MSTMHSRKTHSLGRRRILDISALFTKFPTRSFKCFFVRTGENPAILERDLSVTCVDISPLYLYPRR